MSTITVMKHKVDWARPGSARSPRSGALPRSGRWAGLASLALLAATLATFGASTARAQDLGLVGGPAGQNVLRIGTGLEQGFVASAGYAHRLSLGARPLALYGDLTVPFGGLELSDHRVRIGALMPLWQVGGWQVAAGLGPSLRGSRTGLGRMTGLGLDLQLLGGYAGERWFAAAELGVDWSLTTYVAHSAAYRERVHPHARDGWYAIAGANARAGVQAGVGLDRYTLGLRVGFVRDSGGEAPMLPFYGTLTLGARF